MSRVGNNGSPPLLRNVQSSENGRFWGRVQYGSLRRYNIGDRRLLPLSYHRSERAGGRFPNLNLNMNISLKLLIISYSLVSGSQQLCMFCLHPVQLGTERGKHRTFAPCEWWNLMGKFPWLQWTRRHTRKMNRYRQEFCENIQLV
jgi:hypothetical protein